MTAVGVTAVGVTTVRNDLKLWKIINIGSTIILWWSLLSRNRTMVSWFLRPRCFGRNRSVRDPETDFLTRFLVQVLSLSNSEPNTECSLFRATVPNTEFWHLPRVPFSPHSPAGHPPLNCSDKLKCANILKCTSFQYSWPITCSTAYTFIPILQL